MFYNEDADRLSAVFAVVRPMTQLHGCVTDLIAAREDCQTAIEHTMNANNNLAEFVGPGEDRWVVIGQAVHHIANDDGTIHIDTYIREKTDAAEHI